MPITHPTYITTRTAVGADVNYQCPCGCSAGFAFDRSAVQQSPESCCCGRTILVGASARERLIALLPMPDTYGFDEQPVSMPWGQVLEAVLATPPDAEHGAHAGSDLVHHDGPRDGLAMQAHEAKREGAQLAVTTVHDPVCHMDIAPAAAAGTSSYEGTQYYLCARGCKVDFDEDPAAILLAEAAYDHNAPAR